MNSQTAAATAADFQAVPKRSTVVALAMAALFLAAMDSTAVGTLLPFIKAQMNDAVLYPWLLSGFILTSVVASPIAGKVADALGEKTAMLAALGLFLAGSLAVWWAKDMPSLVCARALQGAGAGAVTVTTYVVIGKLFGDHERGRMQGALSLVWGLAAILGPLLGALIHQHWGWRMVFLLNVPACVAIIALLWLQYPERRDRAAAGATLDPATLAGFALSMSAVLLLMMSESLHLDAALRIGVAAAAIAGLALQAWRVRGHAQRSLVPVAFLTRRAFAVPALLAMIASVVLYGSVTLLPLYISGGATGGDDGSVRGGLMIMASALGWVVGSAVCGGGLNRFGFRNATLFGTVALTVGAVLLLRSQPQSPGWWFAIAQGAIGIGIGFTATAMLVLVQNQSPITQIGGATSGVHLCRNIGASLGINAVAALQIAALAGGGSAAWQGSFHRAFLLLLTLAVIALPLAATLPRTAERRG